MQAYTRIYRTRKFHTRLQYLHFPYSNFHATPAFRRELRRGGIVEYIVETIQVTHLASCCTRYIARELRPAGNTSKGVQFLLLGIATLESPSFHQA